MKGKVWR